jgi:hypothetical protein
MENEKGKKPLFFLLNCVAHFYELALVGMATFPEIKTFIFPFGFHCHWKFLKPLIALLT